MGQKRGVRELRETGEQFLQYLRDTQRDAVTNKDELKVIYEEFKKRDTQKKPSFSSAIYGLKLSGRAHVKKNTVTFYDEGMSKKWSPLTDQYFVMRRSKRAEPVSEKPLDNGNNYSRSEAWRISKWIKNNRSQFTGKNDIHISSAHDRSEGRIRFKCTLGEEFIFPVLVENKSAKPVTFTQYTTLQKMNIFSFSDAQNVSKMAPLILNPGDSYEIRVSCTPAYYGYFPVTLVCESMTENDTSSRGIVGRFISAVCTSKLMDELKPTSKYVPYQKDLFKPSERIEEDGFPLEHPRNSLLEMEIPLGRFPPPAHLRDSIKAGVFCNGAGDKRRSGNPDRDLLRNPLDFNNYKRFHLLLYLEEIQMEVDIRKYDRQNQTMEVDPDNKRLLTLKVPGVAENRPSVLRGDHLFATNSHERGKPRIISYKGCVHGMELERVKLGFSQKFRDVFLPGMLFDVTFTFSLLPLRIQHRAVDLVKENSLKEVIFPTGSYGELMIDVGKLCLYDRSLESNSEQYNAVKHILCGMSRPAPYIIFGPPGTGKTVTLVEAIKQVLKLIPDAHVLACAPSNSASDLLCERLLKHVNPKDIYRIIAMSRDIRTLPEDIKICSNLDSSRKNYIYPSKQELKKYKVIVSTLLTASRLVGANFPHGHFTHVFIDEAGHAVEPECVTAIAGIVDVMDKQTNNCGGQVVLVGDQQQLGPILRSPVAIKHGLGISFLERLMTQNPIYSKKDGMYNPQFVTKLLKNYRSHPSILKIPNQLFYDNELQAVANEMITHCYCKWEMLPKKDFPIIFHGVLGADLREEKSPSFFNLIEIQEVIFYLEELLKTQGKKGLAKISPKEIGIISPYRKQVEKINKAVRMTFSHVPNIKDLKIGSVEEFQGQERKVIIISTVRSSKEFVTFDEDFSLGFVKNPKRFNVAITRAKSLLILVGNPLILGQDPCWSQFLNYCYESGGYRGFKIESKDLDENIIGMFSQLDLNSPPPGEESGESFMQQQLEPAWRHDH
ncbi:putative helicase MOV-10 [Xenopus laevis]|uniref:RNA helicase n=2 Tax=Xenopus laevis TaxID=8355 RepID=A0A1L8HDV6_XENLA|nr:putative helicase MOV-10 [Xenopus laevis]OCT94290.1 hypothetical protein XELAEV_18011958mg [Xenopus laevis]